MMMISPPLFHQDPVSPFLLCLRFLRVLRFLCRCWKKQERKKKESRYDRENYPRIGQGCLDPLCSIVIPVVLFLCDKSPLFFVIFGNGIVGFGGQCWGLLLSTA